MVWHIDICYFKGQCHVPKRTWHSTMPMMWPLKVLDLGIRNERVAIDEAPPKGSIWASMLDLT